jgi:hypothetical protein
MVINSLQKPIIDKWKFINDELFNAVWPFFCQKNVDLSITNHKK